MKKKSSIKKRKSTSSNNKNSNASDLTKLKFGNIEVSSGLGGETRQQSGGKSPTMTTQQGMPVSDDQNSLKVGSRGPSTLEDFHLREKLFHFDHERIPERVVHASGYGAHGYFENYKSLKCYESRSIPASWRKDPRFCKVFHSSW